ncbi:hypothetical protein LCGC14_1865510 [marine sediment metagenome]|uniref:Uncharacterized protein n=1 Tax=marine sediment metagenome TaxID=412755 RepID=A0A0F9G6F7_9ZZZZ
MDRFRAAKKSPVIREKDLRPGAREVLYTYIVGASDHYTILGG